MTSIRPHSSQVRLPFELVGQIVGYVPDALTIRSCALTSGLWYSASRFAVFQVIEIKDVCMAVAFIALLESHPEIGIMVKELSVCVAPPSEPKEAPWLRTLAVALPRLVPRLSVLRFVGWWEDGRNCTGEFLASLSLFTSVRKLSFQACSLPSSILTSVISAFPNVTHLSLQTSISHRPRPRAAALPIHQNPPLTSISFESSEDALYDDEVDNILGWTIDRPGSALKSAKIQILPFGLQATGRFLESSGPCLEHLGISMSQLSHYDLTSACYLQ